MPLDAQQQEKIQQLMAGKGSRCKSCGASNWGVHPEIVMLHNAPAGVVDVTRGFGAIVTFCRGCARVVALDANQVLAE
ncbi:MAG: hypothetical protein M3Q30_04395 [Actinomycetota bacterium]|nr:hypothetical protein [Actinomycetota bacterium]